MAAEFIDMHHPATGGRASATTVAFEQVWRGLGWEVVEDDGAYTQLTFEDVDDTVDEPVDEEADEVRDEEDPEG